MFNFVDLTCELRTISLLSDGEDGDDSKKPKQDVKAISLIDDDDLDALEALRFNLQISLGLKKKAEKMWRLCDEEQIPCAPVGLRKSILRRAMHSMKSFKTKISAANIKDVRYVGNTFRHMVRGIHPRMSSL